MVDGWNAVGWNGSVPYVQFNSIDLRSGIISKQDKCASEPGGISVAPDVVRIVIGGELQRGVVGLGEGDGSGSQEDGQGWQSKIMAPQEEEASGLHRASRVRCGAEGGGVGEGLSAGDPVGDEAEQGSKEGEPGYATRYPFPLS